MVASSLKAVIWWIKRDFRLEDNLALTNALSSGLSVIPLYVIEPEVYNAPDWSNFHSGAVRQALVALRSQLLSRGASLFIGHGPFETIFQNLAQYLSIHAIYSHEETGLEVSFARDRRIRSWLKSKGVPWFESPTNGVVRGLRDRDKRRSVWFARINQVPLPSPEWILQSSAVRRALEDSEVLTHSVIPLSESGSSVQVITEEAALKTVDSFLSDRGYGYSGGISSPLTAFEHGSRLSPHLAWGTVSLRQVYRAAEIAKRYWRVASGEDAVRWRRSLNAFTSRLHWHDHFIQRLESEPLMEFEALNSAFREIEYVDERERLQRWVAGETGVPMVDACMRCLASSGFLNFRMRAMVVSYACHVLHLSWRDILYPLAQLFLDYEPGIHVSQIQMQAGVVGINTVRVYNPDKQMIEQDPEAIFIRRWLPELRDCSVEQIRNYKHLPQRGYPKPIVDYLSSSKKMKSQLYRIKRSAQGKVEGQQVLLKHGSRKRRVGRKKKNTNQLELFSDS